MGAPVKKMESFSPVLEHGSVSRVLDGRIVVETPLGRFEARRAVSCLVAPAAGDRVLISQNGADETFVLAILERTRDVGMDLEMDGPVNVRVRGDLALSASRELTLAGGEELVCTAPTLRVAAEQSYAVLGSLKLLCRRLKSEIKRATAVFQTIELTARRATQRLGNSHRFVEEHDETQAGTSRLLVEDLHTTHSKNSLLVSEEHVTINARQIHLG